MQVKMKNKNGSLKEVKKNNKITRYFKLLTKLEFY